MSHVATAHRPPHLPDVNAGRYSFEVVQALLEASAYLDLLSVPGPGEPIAGATGETVGWRITEHLHRFSSQVETPSATHPLRARERVGERLAAFTHRWLLAPDPFRALPGVEPPATPFDPTRPQRVVLLDSVCRFADVADRFDGFGTGRTFPTVGGGAGEVGFAAVGTWIGGDGRWRHLPFTTYTHCGSLDPAGAFRGSLTVRAMDPDERLDRHRELPPWRERPIPETDVSYVLLHGRKPGPRARTRLRFDAAGRPIGLEVFQDLTAFEVDAAIRPGGLACRSSVGRVVGTMRSEIDFDLLHPGAPGTAESPIPFGAVNHFTLFDLHGEPLGGFVGDGSEGRTFRIDFPGAPGQQGLRFGGFGQLRDGYGRFAGISGLMTDNSAVGLSPHVTSTLYMLRIDDPAGRFRRALGGEEGRAPAVAPGGGSRPAPGRRPPFEPLRERKRHFLDTFAGWRERFRRCAGAFAGPIAEAFAAVRTTGELEGLPIDPATLAASFEAGAGRFHEPTFERYRGRANAVFRTYDRASGREAAAFELFSVWDERSGRDGEWLHKEITGSPRGYVPPAEVPVGGAPDVELLVNSFHPRVGTTSWVVMEQGRRARASIAYRLPRDHEVLWIVEEVTVDGRPIEDGRFMASHEWKERRDGRTVFPMIGIFFRVDWERCRVEVDGDVYWKALYRKEGPADEEREP